MKRILIVAALVLGMACVPTCFNETVEAKETSHSKTRKSSKKSSRTKKKSSSRGYRVEYGRIIPTAGKPVIVDFYTDWCGPCQRYKPIFEAVKRDYSNMAVFIRINTETNREIANYYNIHSIPTTYYIYPDGRTAGYFSGGVDYNYLVNFLYRYY